MAILRWRNGMYSLNTTDYPELGLRACSMTFWLMYLSSHHKRWCDVRLRFLILLTSLVSEAQLS